MKIESYAKFKTAFVKEYFQQRQNSEKTSESKFLQKVSDRAKRNYNQMRAIVDFFKIDDISRDSLYYGDLLLAVEDSNENKEKLKNIYVQIQKNRYPILQTNVGWQNTFGFTRRGQGTKSPLCAPWQWKISNKKLNPPRRQFNLGRGLKI